MVVEPPSSLTLLLAVLSLGCGNELIILENPPPPTPRTTALVEGLELRLEGVPDSIRSGDSFTVAGIFKNMRDEAITLLSGNSCLFLINIFRDAERVAMSGSGFGCLATPTNWVVPAHDSIHRVSPVISAVIDGVPAVEPDGEPHLRQLDFDDGALVGAGDARFGHCHGP